MDTFKNILIPLPNMSKEYKPLIPYQHDKYLTPDSLKLAVLNSPRIRELCIEVAQTEQRKPNHVTKLVKEILDEIGLAHSLPAIRILGICLNKIFMGMTSGVYVHGSSIDLVKSRLSSGMCPVIYLPSHRSYADFILMSYICFVHDLEIPAIAAGMDFHAMIFMGTLLRNTGAFFIRRSFANDKVYGSVFKEYVRQLMTQYHTGLEFFIEGTRSRSNKALSPKFGLLSMALQPFFSRDIYDVIVVPVGVAYDKLLEEVLFAYELLGVPKPRESTMRFIRALDILKVNHGNMFIKFGAPISLKECVENFKRQLPPNTGNIVLSDKENQKQILNNLAYEVVDSQQKMITITPFNLATICYCYRTYIRGSTQLGDVVNSAEKLQVFLERLSATVAINDCAKLDTQIAQSLDTHSNLLKLSGGDQGHIELVRPAINLADGNGLSGFKAHQLTTTTMLNSLPAILLQLYSNPCIHWLHVPAFYILAKRITTDTDQIQGHVRELRRIFATEFVTDIYNAANMENQYLAVAKLNSSEIDDLIVCSIGPFLLCYLNVAATISHALEQSTHATSYSFTEKELYVHVQKSVEAKLLSVPRSPLVHPLCLCLDTIANALQSLTTNQYVSKRTGSNGSAAKYTPDRMKIKQLHEYLLECCEPLKQFHFAANTDLLCNKL